MLVAHVEQRGVWTIDGGMVALARTLTRLAAEAGVSFRFAAEVIRIETKFDRATAVHTRDGERISADAIVFNGDANALADILVEPNVAQRPATPIVARSLSAVTWATVATPRGLPLVRHNVLFSDDYASEFADIFRKRRLPETPTVYVCAQDRDDNSRPPSSDGERLLCLVNAPATGDQDPSVFAPAEIDKCHARMATTLLKCGLALEMPPEATVVTTPADFAALFPATGGALYGRNAHGWTASFQRPGAKTSIPGLYLAGGSVHPGPGVPMAALSGRRAVSTLLTDRASTHPFRRAAMRGGTSTP
jgi:1-hydroxycarotenoid 3,4-desaturase